jgi:hypothetical protein
MMDAGGELYWAVNGLRKGAEAGLTGNSYYQAANRIADLMELIGTARESAASSKEAGPGFPLALADARKSLALHLSGNRFYMAINKLEELGSFLPAAQPPAQRRQSFDELAAASKARTQEAAASLGIVTARTASLPGQFAETLADGELERRSSEPCLMAELAPPALEPVAAAAIFTEAAAPARRWEAAQNLGSPPAESEHSAVRGTIPAAATAHPADAAPALHPSASAYDSETASAGQTVESAGDPAADENPDEAARGAPAPASAQPIQVKKPDQTKPKEPKTLFKLWLDLAFGRKD